MKRIFNFCVIMAALALSVFASSCRELAQNGDFSGQWQVLSIEYPDGTTVDPCGTLYYCIYRDVAQLTAPNDIRVTGNLHYDEDARMFSIQFPRDTPEYLAQWGIEIPDDNEADFEQVVARFAIDTLTSSRLVMTGATGIVVTCRKF